MNLSCAPCALEERQTGGLPMPYEKPKMAHRFFGFIFFLLFFNLPGCAKQSAQAEWQFSQESETLYYYLIQLEAVASGDVEAFKEAGNKLLDLEPEESVFLEMAEFSLRRNQLEEARRVAGKGLNLYPASLPLTLIVSDSYLQQLQPDEAINVLVRYTAEHPDNKDAMQELARTYLLGEKYTEFDRLIRKIPAKEMTPYLHYLKARMYLGTNRLEEGERELRLAVRQAPEMSDAWLDLAITLQMQEKYTAALPILVRALENDPENLVLWLRLIEGQLRAKQFKQALKTLNNAPDAFSLKMEAGMLFAEAKQYSTARKIFQEVRDTPGAPEEIHLYLAALALENLNEPAEALRELAAISPQSPLAERALRWRLQILENEGRSNESVSLAKEYAEQDPESAEFQLIYAQALSIKGASDESLAVLRKAFSKWPENTLIAYSLAVRLDLSGDKDEALKLMEFVLARNPNSVEAMNYVGYTLAENNTDLERAYDLLRKASAAAPDDPHITDSLAWVLYRLGDRQNAWITIRKSIGQGGDHPTIWEHYGDIAHSIGNNTEARRGYEKALDLSPENPEELREKLRKLP